MPRPATSAIRLLAGEREPCRLATTANITLSGLQTIDGVLTVVGNRVLVKNQTDATRNGIYTASAGTWYRAADARSPRTINKGITVHVQEGTANGGNIYVFQTLNPDIGNDEILISFMFSDGIVDQMNAALGTASALVGSGAFLQAGLNALTRSNQDKIRDSTLSITDYHSSDTTLGLQRAMAAATALGKTQVYVPEGARTFVDTIEVPQGVTLFGAFRNPAGTQHFALGGSRLLFRPNAGATTALKVKEEASGVWDAAGVGFRDFELDLNADDQTGIYIPVSYSCTVRNVVLNGIWDVGIHVVEAYVCDFDWVSFIGQAKRRCLHIGHTNASHIRRFHSSCLPTDVDTSLIGIAIEGTEGVGGHGTTIDSPILQGLTVGISIGKANTTFITNPYCENILSFLRTNDVAAGQNSVGTMVLGGNIGSVEAPHPQYASRGPLVYLPYSDDFQMKGTRFQTSNDDDASVFPIVVTETTGMVTLDSFKVFPGTESIRDNIFRETTNSTCGLTVLGSEYGSNRATEMILKKDGAFGLTCYRLGINTSGTVTTTAYQPSVIGSAVSDLLKQAMALS